MGSICFEDFINDQNMKIQSRRLYFGKITKIVFIFNIRWFKYHGSRYKEYNINIFFDFFIKNIFLIFALKARPEHISESVEGN